MEHYIYIKLLSLLFFSCSIHVLVFFLHSGFMFLHFPFVSHPVFLLPWFFLSLVLSCPWVFICFMHVNPVFLSPCRSHGNKGLPWEAVSADRINFSSGQLANSLETSPKLRWFCSHFGKSITKNRAKTIDDNETKRIARCRKLTAPHLQHQEFWQRN